MIHVKGSGGGVDLSQANAGPEHVLNGMKFFSGGSKAVQTGTLITGQVWSYTYTGANTDTTSDGIRTITITSSGIFTPDYDMSATVTVQGGGGGGGGYYTSEAAMMESSNRGGAGGNGYDNMELVQLVAGTPYEVVIGAGGTAGGSTGMAYRNSAPGGGTGGASSAFGVSANGGAGGAGASTGNGAADIVRGANGSGGPGALTANGGTGGVNTTSSTVSATAGGAGRVQIQFAV